MGNILGIINQKGGVGKTTTAVNLAACLAEKGQKTLLVDCDSQGNATSGLGIDKDELTCSLYEVMEGQAEARDAVIKTDIKKLHILPSSVSLAGIELTLVDRKEREFALKKSLMPLKHQYDYIILDCPPSLGLMTVNVLAASDAILIPIQAEFYALEGMSQLMDSVRAVQCGINPSLQIEGVLLTMYNGRTNLSIQVAEKVKELFGDKVFHTFIPRSVRLSEAPGFGEPIVTYDPKSKGAEAYRALCREVLRRER